MRAVLAAGSRSPSHLAAVLKRYASVIEQLLGSCRQIRGGGDSSSGDVAQRILVCEAAEFYGEVPQKVGHTGHPPPHPSKEGRQGIPHPTPPQGGPTVSDEGFSTRHRSRVVLRDLICPVPDC